MFDFELIRVRAVISANNSKIGLYYNLCLAFFLKKRPLLVKISLSRFGIMAPLSTEGSN